MFGMGVSEILIILVVALLVVGPDKLPSAAKAIGKGIRDLRRHTLDLQDTIEQDENIGGAVRELKNALHGDPRAIVRSALNPARPAAPGAPPAIPPPTPNDVIAGVLAGQAGAPAAAAPPTPPDHGPPRPVPAIGAIAKGEAAADGDDGVAPARPTPPDDPRHG